MQEIVGRYYYAERVEGKSSSLLVSGRVYLSLNYICIFPPISAYNYPRYKIIVYINVLKLAILAQE